MINWVLLLYGIAILAFLLPWVQWVHTAAAWTQLLEDDDMVHKLKCFDTKIQSCNTAKYT